MRNPLLRHKRALLAALVICLLVVIAGVWGDWVSMTAVGSSEVVVGPPGCTLHGAKYSPGAIVFSRHILCTRGQWVKVNAAR